MSSVSVIEKELMKDKILFHLGSCLKPVPCPRRALAMDKTTEH